MSLLTDRPWLVDLWEEAQRKPEHATTALWENIFAEVFPYQQYNVASQQPPTEHLDDRRRIDLVVRPRNRLGGPRAALLFMEAKKSGVSPSLVQECEEQALTACWGYLNQWRMDAVWAMTCVGSKTRIWACRRPRSDSEDDYLVPVFPLGANLADIDEYVEIAERGLEVLNWLEYIKANLTPPETILNGSGVMEVPVLPSQSHLLSGGYPSSQHSYDALSAAAGSSGHSHPADAVVDASQCHRVTVLRERQVQGQRVYECSRGEGKKPIKIIVDGWRPCTALFNGEHVAAHVYVSDSGDRYLAPTLTPRD